MGSLVAYNNGLSEEEKLELIVTQKYFTSFHQSGWRMYFDNLRTGYPAFVQEAGVTPPTRWIYPLSEYNNNSDNVASAIESQFGTGNDKIRETTWWLE